MNLKYSLPYFVFVIVLLVGCSQDDDQPRGQYDHGAFIVNEGGLGKSNGTVTYYNAATGPEENILQLNTAGFTGDVVQSISFSGDKGYVVLNGDNKIVLVQSGTFADISTLSSEDIIAPRYVHVIGGKAYISVWGPYDENYALVDSYVLVYDVTHQTTVKKIDTDEGTENLTAAGNYIFASNYNYGASNTVAVIRPSDDSLVKQIEVGAGPAGSVVDSNGKLWVVCAGMYGATDGQLVRINTASLEVEQTIGITAGQPGIDIALSPDGQTLYYTVGISVYALPVTATAEAPSPLFEAKDVTTLYSLDVEPATGKIWIGDALDYSAPGKVYIYTADGALAASVAAGIAPGQVVFK